MIALQINELFGDVGILTRGFIIIIGHFYVGTLLIKIQSFYKTRVTLILEHEDVGERFINTSHTIIDEESIGFFGGIVRLGLVGFGCGCNCFGLNRLESDILIVDGLATFSEVLIIVAVGITVIHFLWMV